MPTLLITGANRGIGLELTRQYLKDDWKVFACCRNPASAMQLNKLGEDSDNLTIVGLDVTDDRAIGQLTQQLSNESIDLLLNNAGIYGGQGNRFGTIDREEWLQVLTTNTISPLMMAQAFVEQVARSTGKTIATISSKVGSIDDNQGGSSYMYRSSKTAVNQAMKSLSIDLADRGIKAAILHPGWVQTDMGGPNALIDTQTSASGIKNILDNFTMEQSGGFFNYDGSTIPW